MSATSDGSATAANPPKRGRSGRRWRRGLAYGLLVLVLVTAGVWFAAPSVLRHLAGMQLDMWGIAYSGLDTLEVDLWRQRLRLGPVGFHAAGAAAGKATRLDARIDLGALFQRRVLINELRAQGLDLLLERDGAGKFRLNGVLLNPSRNAGKTRGRPPWGWGVERIALDNGRLLFQRAGGESPDLRARHLEATDLLSWDAESSSRASLVGELNGSAVDWKADLRLFRDPLSIDLVFRSEGLVVAKYLADLIERGSFDFRPEAGRAVGHMLLEFPRRGGFRIRGNTDFEVARGALSLRQLEAGWQQLHLHWSDLDLRVAPDRDFSLALQYEYKGRGGRLNGPLELSTDLLFDLLEILQTLVGPEKGSILILLHILESWPIL